MRIFEEIQGWGLLRGLGEGGLAEVDRSDSKEVAKAKVAVIVDGAITDIRRYNPATGTWVYDYPVVDVGQKIGLKARITNTGNVSQRMRLDCLVEPPTAASYTITGVVTTLSSGGYTDRDATWLAIEAGDWKATLILYAERF